jgi:L-lactate dehydrogenase complex protein LldF
MPAIHKKREEIDDLFHRALGTSPSGGDAEYLAREARRHLRGKFLSADAAITGVNFAVAETGAVVVCTNEGNADMGVHATRLHIACLGIEKVVPTLDHLGVFLRLLARSATGQPITSYTSFYRAPRPGSAMHFVIVDNGRSRQLGRPAYRSSLRCIRCGACMNTCPVYRRSGGSSYRYVIPGPIGAILAPGADLDRFADLPFASTLCGSCADICPVKIDIHAQLYRWRQLIVDRKLTGPAKRIVMMAAGTVFSHPRLYRGAGKTVRLFLRVAPAFASRMLGAWGKQRDYPRPPARSFGEWYAERGGK